MNFWTKVYCQYPHPFVSIQDGNCKNCGFMQFLSKINFNINYNNNLFHLGYVTWREFKSSPFEFLSGYCIDFDDLSKDNNKYCTIKIEIRKFNINLEIGGIIFDIGKCDVKIKDFKLIFKDDTYLGNSNYIKKESYIYLI